jgi:tripartite ATP-independent transporter DctM subunit
MFAALFVLLALGVPIAFSFAAIAIGFSYVLWGPGAVNLLISAAWGAMNNFVIVAVPLFIFMSYILQKTGVVDDLYDTIFKWSSGVRGGLAIASIVVGAVIGSISGVVAAGVIGLGLIALPQMLKHKYDKGLALGTVMGAGTLGGQLIPPSTNMVIYGCVSGVSIGGLFAAGMVTGLFLAILYIAYIIMRGVTNPEFYPPAVPAAERPKLQEKLMSLKNVFFPILLILLVLGSILKGVASPTEAAAFGAGGALLIGLLKRCLTWDMVYTSCYQTLLVSSMVGWTMIGAGAFGSVFSGLGGNTLVTNIAMNMPGGPNMVFAVFAVFIFFLGLALEPNAIIFLAVPIIDPILRRLGFDPLFIGLSFQVLLQTAYLSPPFGLSVVYLHSVAPPGVTLIDLYKAGVPFLAMQIICLVVIFFFPDLFLWLPKFLFSR